MIESNENKSQVRDVIESLRKEKTELKDRLSKIKRSELELRTELKNIDTAIQALSPKRKPNKAPLLKAEAADVIEEILNHSPTPLSLNELKVKLASICKQQGRSRSGLRLESLLSEDERFLKNVDGRFSLQDM